MMIEYILLANTVIFGIVLVVLLIISSMKSHKHGKKNSKMSDEMIKIKEQISEDIE